MDVFRLWKTQRQIFRISKDSQAKQTALERAAATVHANPVPGQMKPNGTHKLSAELIEARLEHGQIFETPQSWIGTDETRMLRIFDQRECYQDCASQMQGDDE